MSTRSHLSTANDPRKISRSYSRFLVLGSRHFVFVFVSSRGSSCVILSFLFSPSLRIIPGATSFLVLPKNVSRSTAVGAILQPGGVRAPTSTSTSTSSSTVPGQSGSALADALINPNANAGDSPFDFILAVGGDNRLIRRINDLPNSETCSTNLKNSDATWRLVDGSVIGALLKIVE